jgi:uncharacterized small protein (DUF1192 family)
LSLSSTEATLLIGLPSLAVAATSLALSARAQYRMRVVAEDKADALAYTSAQKLYESSIAELRTQIADLHGEVARLKAELAAVIAEREHLRGQQGPG